MNNLKDLIPSEDEVKEILAQVMATDPAQAPVVLLRIELAKLVLKFVDRVGKDLSKSIERLEGKINRKLKE